MGCDTEGFLDSFRKVERHRLFAMDYEDFRLVREGPEPIQKLLPVSMGRETVDGVNTGSDRYGFTKDGDGLGAVDYFPAKGPFSLEADKNDAAFGPPKVMFQMMLDAAAFAHAAARDYYSS
jgi:hypothetical protein